MKFAIPSPNDQSSIIIYGIASSLGLGLDVEVVANQPATLTNGDKNITGEIEIIKHLFEASGKSLSLDVNKDLSLEALNEKLGPVVYVDGGIVPSYSDFYYFSTLHKTIAEQKAPQRAQFCNVTRWFAHIQSFYESASVFPNIDFRISFNPKFFEASGNIIEEEVKNEAPKQQQQQPQQQQQQQQKRGNQEKKQEAVKEEQKPAEEAKKEAPARQQRAPREKKAQGQGQGQGQGRGRQEKKAPPPGLSHLKIQIGRVTHVERHPTLEKLLIEKIDIGEAEPRVVVSGLAKFITPEEFNGKLVVLVTNLTPGEFAGVFSSGLVLCASDDSHEKVEILEAPEGATVGELVRIQGDTNDPDAEVNGKGFQKYVKGLETDADCKVVFKGAKVLTASGGEITVKSLAKARIK